jgi:glycosyltransferase involved in cell wall biosynthesis
VHVTALVESTGHVCCRYRVAAFKTLLERAGHRLEVRPLPNCTWHWWRLGRDLRGTEAVILQRKLLPRWERFLLRRAAPILLYDFDDAVFLRDSYASRGFRSLRRLRRFVNTVRAADVVIAGNAHLAGEAARWIARERIHVIPTCVDPTAYPPAEHDHSGPGARLVWVGSSSTLHGLERARPILEKVGRCCPGSSLKIVCDKSISLRHLPVLSCPWSEGGEGEALATADIGLSWVPDDPWSRGKCGLKVLQYMAAGLPVVANPVGVQAVMVRHEETGLLAKTPDEWAEAITRLARDADLRRRMGTAGRRLLESEYSVSVGARRWLALLEGFQQRRKVA